MAGGHGSLEASIFDRGIHILAVVAVILFCVIFVALLHLEVVFFSSCFLLLWLISPSPSLLLGFWLIRLSRRAYLSPSILTSEAEFYNFPKWWSRYQPPNIMLLQASSRAVVFKLVRV